MKNWRCGQTELAISYAEMGRIMSDDDPEDRDLLIRLDRGDEQALCELFARHRGRLRRMIRLRLDRRLQGRIDSSDVLQDA